MKLRNVVLVLTRIRQLFLSAVSRRRDTTSTLSSAEEEVESENFETLENLGYTLGEKLGEGSYSCVVKAHSELHERDVAIKIINRKRQSNRTYVEKYLSREIDLIKRIDHVHVVKLLDVVETKLHVYIIMNLASNGTLLEAILKHSYLDERRACRWFHHLVDGIAFCHAMGIAHRDLKCDNLLIDKHNVLKITDFSLARGDLPPYIINGEENVDRCKLLSSTFCGSYAYSCPEILLRRPYEPHLADTWSMGVILYAMLTGRLPFDDTSLCTVIYDIRKPVIFYENPVLSVSVRRLIRKILSPSRIRIYIPTIRMDDWYINTFQEGEEVADSDYKRKVAELKEESS